MITPTATSFPSRPDLVSLPVRAAWRGGRTLLAAAALAVVATVPAGSASAATDLGITVATSNATPVVGGAAFSYTLTVTNSGPDFATNIVVLDPLPPGIVFQNSSVVNNTSPAGFGLVCSGPPVGENGVVTCQGSLPAAASTSTITIVAQVGPGLASGVRTNTVTVSSDTQEVSPNVSPNVASVQQSLQVNAPLSITISGPATIVRGTNAVYEIAVNNGGNSTALNATFSDPLPASTTFLSLFGTGPLHDGCSVNPGGTVTCAAVDVPTGVHRLTLVVKTSPNTPLGNLSNTATITSAGTGTIVVGTSTTTATVTP